MKKVILSLAVIALGFAATSCKKYTCTCYDNSGAVIGTSTTSASTLAGAEVKCEQKTTASQDCY